MTAITGKSDRYTKPTQIDLEKSVELRVPNQENREEVNNKRDQESFSDNVIVKLENKH